MCIVMETNELMSIDDKLVDTNTIHTTMSIYSLLNVDSRDSDWTKRRQAVGLLPQGAHVTTQPSFLYAYFICVSLSFAVTLYAFILCNVLSYLKLFCSVYIRTTTLNKIVYQTAL